MITAEHCLLSGSRDEAVLKVWGLQGSERLGNLLCCILVMWVEGGLGKGYPNTGKEGQCHLLTYLQTSQMMLWGEG